MAGYAGQVLQREPTVSMREAVRGTYACGDPLHTWSHLSTSASFRTIPSLHVYEKKLLLLYVVLHMFAAAVQKVNTTLA